MLPFVCLTTVLFGLANTKLLLLDSLLQESLGYVMLPFVCLTTVLFGLANTKDIFKIALSELQSSVDSGYQRSLERVLKDEGAFAITNLDPSYAIAVRQIKSKAPECLEQLKFPQFYLPDGSQRRTFARESTQTSHYPSCIREESESISAQMTHVDNLMSRLITSIAGEKSLVWREGKGGEEKNFASTNFKEHIHVYKPMEGGVNAGVFAAPFHTDNGLLLMVTPFQEHPLQIKNRAGDYVSTASVAEDSLLVLIANGLPHWLLQGTKASDKFFSVPHAVPSINNELLSRVVFARMKVVPGESFPTNAEIGKANQINTFKQFFHDGPGVGSTELCPLERPQYQALAMQTRSVEKQMHEQCKEGEAWCWMNCLPVPQEPCANKTLVCTNQYDKPCCTDDNMDGECMDQSCAWKQPCEKMGDVFCQPGSGTDMYMQGFVTSGKAKEACVILLFNSWVLNSREKFAIGCVGVIFLGIAIEAMLCLRRLLQSGKVLRRLRGLSRRGAIIFLFALNIASGYLAMLVAMTYSVELFICMVVGLVAGHAFFNSEAPVGESVDPCCASQREELLPVRPCEEGPCAKVGVGCDSYEVEVVEKEVQEEEGACGHCTA